jgi:hypothetical protein
VVFGTSWHFLALLGTIWHLLAPGFAAAHGKHGKKQKLGKVKAEIWDSAASQSGTHRVLVFHPAGATDLLDLWRSSTKNNVKEQPGGPDKSLLKLYFFFTRSGFF